MEFSAFMDKDPQPTFADVKSVVGKDFELWQQIYATVYGKYPKAVDKWSYPGKKYGWSFCIKDKRRAIIYFLPRDGYFKVAFVFGQKAYDEIMSSDIADVIKKELSEAKKYAEGRGIRINAEETILDDIKKLIDIKLKY